MIFALVGPTGIGKSALAVEYAKRNGAYIINGDAFQCYREMSIGTAKPSAEERSEVPHYLYDIATVREPYTIFEYQRDLRRTLDELIPTGRPLVIVGGSGLYLKSALYDFTFSEASVRPDMSAYEAMDSQALHAELRKLDEPSAAAIHPNNRKRVLRAIEIYLSSGKQKSEWILSQQHTLLYDVTFIGLETPSREELYALIDRRVEQMMEAGLAEEVHELVERYGTSLRAFQAIGYKELIEGERRDIPLEESVALIQKHTRNYAKRQYTYFKNQLPVHWFSSRREALHFMEREERADETETD